MEHPTLLMLDCEPIHLPLDADAFIEDEDVTPLSLVEQIRYDGFEIKG